MENSPAFLQLVLFLTFIVLLIPVIIGMWKVFVKAGQPGWAAIIPIYNVYIMTKIAGKPGWWTILACIPYIGLIWQIWLYNMISKSFGKDEAMTVAMVFAIGWLILGFGSARYKGPYGDPVAFAEYNTEKFDFETPNHLTNN